MFCESCGEAIKEEAELCPNCGVRNGQVGSGRGSGAVSEDLDSAPTKPLYGLIICWFIWFIGVAAYQSGSPLGILALLSIIASLVLLYNDATAAKKSGELEIENPIFVPIVVMLIWVIAVPIYVLYRFSKR